jgi:hypothetical protein
VCSEAAQYSKLSGDGLATAGGRAQQHILIGVIHCVEDLQITARPGGLCLTMKSDTSERGLHPAFEGLAVQSDVQTMVRSYADLRLDGVEVGETVQALEGGVVQC